MQRSSCRQSIRPSDDRAVSEVLGQLLIFGILSLSLVMAMVGFNVAKENATERVIELRADSVAQIIELRVREAVELIDLHQEIGTDEFAYNFTIPLDHDIEGYDYQVNLDWDMVTVSIARLGYEATANIHQRVSVEFEACDGDDINGGPLAVHALRITASNSATVPDECISSGIGDYVLFIQEAP